MFQSSKSVFLAAQSPSTEVVSQPGTTSDDDIIGTRQGARLWRGNGAVRPLLRDNDHCNASLKGWFPSGDAKSDKRQIASHPTRRNL